MSFNLNKSVLRIVTRLDNSYTYDVDVEKVCSTNGTANVTYILKGGFAISILQELSSYLNFSYELVTDPPSLTYRFDEAENLSIDLFAASYSVIQRRALRLSPTFAIGESRVQIFINHRFESSLEDYVLLPFQPNVWLFFLFLVILFSFFLGICYFLLEKISFADGIFITMYTFLQKGIGEKDPTAITSRITFFIASISTIIIWASYSGKIVSISAVKLYSIDSLEKLVSSDFEVGFDIGSDNGSVIQDIAQELAPEQPVMSALLSKTFESKFVFKNFEDSIDEVNKRPFAYIIDEETGRHTVEKVLGYFPCSFGAHSFAKVQYPWAFFVRKSSKLRPPINYGILRLSEMGALRKFIRRWVPREGQMDCSKQNQDSFAKIQLHQVKTAFIILAAGFLLSFLLAIVEMAKNRYERSLWLLSPKLNIVPVVQLIKMEDRFK